MTQPTDPTDNTVAIVPVAATPAAQTAIGAVADTYARAGVFADYCERKAKNTLRRQKADLALFALYLITVKFLTPPKGQSLEESELQAADAFQHRASMWTNITYGLVSGFVRWQLQEGYAVSSVNIRTSTVKQYASLAFTAGALSLEQHALIRTIKGYQEKEKPHIDEKRTDAGTPTRVGAKKEQIHFLSKAQVAALKDQPDTPQGRRDRLLICLLFDHGLRCGEIALLDVTAVNFQDGTLTFFRPKVNKTQTHRLTADTFAAAQAWFASGDALAEGSLLRGSANGGALTFAGMSERAITARVKTLGARVLGISDLSAHDGRHTWATFAARNKTDVIALRDAGGWSSLIQPGRYIESAKIANEGVNLGSD